ncbi:MAG: major capsid protein [Brevinema sp.]
MKDNSLTNQAFQGVFQDTANPMSDVETVHPRKSSFPLGQLAQGTVDAGQVFPIFARLAVPGDVFSIENQMIVRANQLASPAMTNYKVKSAFFAVPLRILWNHSKDDRFTVFINGGKEGTLAPNIPKWDNIVDNKKYSLADYFGLPLGKKWADVKPNAFFPRAYLQVINDYFITEEVFAQDGFDITDVDNYNLPLFNPAWEPDYFNKAFTRPQRGDAPAIPIIGAGETIFETVSGWMTTSPVNYIGIPGGEGEVKLRSNAYKPTSSGSYLKDKTIDGNTPFTSSQGTNQTFYKLESDLKWEVLKPFLEQNRVDFTNNSGVFINDLRLANAVQLALEMSMKIGYRYNEFVFGNFGVKTSDARMQRAEMIGDLVEAPIIINQVEQTTPTDNSPLGSLGGNAITATNGFVGSYEVEEHSVILGLQWIMPERSIYWQGLHPEWTYNDRFDFYLPMFAHLGEQPIKSQELYYSDDPVYNVSTFGYQQAFAHMRTGTTILTGDFRDFMNYYVTSRNFDEASKPILSQEFIHQQPNKNIFVGQNKDYKSFIYTSNVIVKASRPLPVISDPSLLL